jgi:hypothetical protein
MFSREPSAPSPYVESPEFAAEWRLIPALYKEKIAVVTLTSNVLQGLLGVLSPHHFNLFGIVTLACIALTPSLVSSVGQLPAFLSGFLSPVQPFVPQSI